MSLNIQKTPLLLGLSGGSLIMSGVSAMNTMPTKNLQKLVGIPAFTAGWILIAKGFLKNDTRLSKYKGVLAGASAGVFFSAVTARMLTDAGVKGTPVMISKMIFLASWITIGVAVGMKKHGSIEEDTEEVHDLTAHGLGLLPPALVVTSMGIINNIERPRKIAGGMGMGLFGMAWVILALVNSVKFESPRDKMISCAESVLNTLKRKHHDLIVTALENGADEEEHIRLLAVKEEEVLAGMAEAEERLNIVFDKEEPTKQGPVRVTEVL